ncbi:MAG: hypothetical protein K6B17_07145 [Treponema sp.]|nr:hypothetical protein [Treponema sp.]
MNTLEYFSDFHDWKSKKNDFSLLDYLPLKINSEQLLLANLLFFPKLVEEDGCFFIEESRQKKFLEQAKNSCKDKSSLEKYINCIFLECMFICKTDKDRKLIQHLAEHIKHSWDLWFKEKYPELNMVTEIYEDEFDGWCITCYQICKLKTDQ